MLIEILYVAVLCFAASVIAAVRSVRSPRGGLGFGNFAGLVAGFGVLTLWLYARGRVVGSCPLNSLFDVLVFLAWALVLMYLLVGPAYRLSLMGAFTAPLALALMLVALVGPMDRAPVPRMSPDPWVELHAALALIAYGSFGLACVAGGMYLLQEHQLKSGRFSALARKLPPIADLAVVNRRLLAWGFALLTLGFASGFASGSPVHGAKFWASAAIWAGYGVVLASNKLWPMAPGRLAGISVGIFVVVLFSLPAIQHFSVAL